MNAVGSFFAVVSPPRSGTKWYSKLFSHEDVHCFHELTTLIQPWPVKAVYRDAFFRETGEDEFEQRQRRFFLEAYPRYFSRLAEQVELGRRWVGNSDNSLATFAAGLWLVWPETRFLFSVRNGINQVNSALLNEVQLEGIVRAARPASLPDVAAFETCCRRWASLVERLEVRRCWLESRGAQCLSTTLERVTSDAGELERVWNFVAGNWERHADRAVSLMQRPVNQWVNVKGAVYGADEIWATWSKEQRTQFTEICGRAQQSYGYEIPALHAGTAQQS